MDEQREGQMRRRFGMSRRDLIRRGAIVGGTLIWTVPIVKTIANAQIQPGASPFFTCCECRSTGPGAAFPAGSERCNNGTNLSCTSNATSTIGSTTYRTDLQSGCQAYCQAQGRSFCFHRASTPIGCTGNVCGAQ
jgi:hypothetical protein